MHWICPNCATSLELVENSYRCERGHSFDRAKQSYVNLLLVNQKHSKDPGDNADMIEARRQFLSQGLYEPLVNALFDEMTVVMAGQGGAPSEKQPLSNREPSTVAALSPEVTMAGARILDMGCGEGYYLRALVDRIISRGLLNNESVSASYPATPFQYHGLDISKNAVKRASADKRAHFAVASSFNIPLPPSSKDIILNIFAPFDFFEVERLLAPGGHFFCVSPGPRHLYQLKEYLYPQPQEHKQNPTEDYEKLKHVHRRSLHYSIEVLGSDLLQALLKMTPYYWKGNRALKEKLLEASCFSTEVDFNIDIWKQDIDG